MTPRDIAPWILTVAAVGMAAWSWTRPVQTVETTRLVAGPTAGPTVIEGADAAEIQRLVRDTMRAELEGIDIPAARPVEMGPEVELPAPVAADLDDALGLVDDLARLDQMDQEDVLDVRFALDSLHPEQRKAFMSAYFTALNSGEIRVHGAPL